MRLFDKVAAHGPPNLRSACAKASHDFPVIVVDPIAEHYATSKQMLWDSGDYPYARPPWDICFVEWNEPKEVLTIHGVITNSGTSQAGSLVAFSSKPGCVEATKKHVESLTQQKQNDFPELCTCICLLRTVIAAKGQIKDLNVSTFWLMTNDGRIERVIHVGHGLGDFFSKIGNEETQRFFDNFTHITALAFTFANCANVKLEDVTEELQPPAKIRRRLKLPEVKRYTLNIAGHVSRPSRDYNEGPQGVMPFHLCRGHFATYTAERPMFGNPKLVGRYWHPPHMKGKKEQGEIIKDYAIKG